MVHLGIGVWDVIFANSRAMPFAGAGTIDLRMLEMLRSIMTDYAVPDGRDCCQNCRAPESPWDILSNLPKARRCRGGEEERRRREE